MSEEATQKKEMPQNAMPSRYKILVSRKLEVNHMFEFMFELGYQNLSFKITKPTIVDFSHHFSDI